MLPPKIPMGPKKISQFGSAVGPAIANKSLPGHPWVTSTNFSPFGPAVWPAIANIYRNIYEQRALLYR